MRKELRTFLLGVGVAVAASLFVRAYGDNLLNLVPRPAQQPIDEGQTT